jgi:hypothetical protein
MQFLSNLWHKMMPLQLALWVMLQNLPPWDSRKDPPSQRREDHQTLEEGEVAWWSFPREEGDLHQVGQGLDLM